MAYTDSCSVLNTEAMQARATSDTVANGLGGVTDVIWRKAE